MTVTVAERLRFCERHLKTKEGRQFSLTGRDWVRDELFVPACSGWKLWPRDPDKLCELHKQDAGEVREWEPGMKRGIECDDEDCAGLDAHPLVVSLLNLPRREGKTFNTAALILSELFLGRDQYVLYVASAGKQTRTLFQENFVSVIGQNKTLQSRCVIRGETIRVPKNNTKLEVVETSYGSITGRGRTLVVIDEARDVHPRVASAAALSIRDQNGANCPSNYKHTRGLPADEAPDDCPVCGSPLVPWYGRMVVESSSGFLDGTELEWFARAVEQREADPKKNTHLFRTVESSNPVVSAQISDALSEAFGDVEEIATYLEVETSNIPQRAGEQFVPERALRACIDRRAVSQLGVPHKCVAYLDTSLTQDLTSLVVLAEQEDCEKQWQRVYVAHVATWDPAKMRGGAIDPNVVQDHLDTVLPLFPGLMSLTIDTRGSRVPWARDMVGACRDRPWGRLVKSEHGGRPERDTGWALLGQRIAGGTITLLSDRTPEGRRLLEELRGVRRVVRADNTVEIRDKSRKKRHAELAEGLAQCCWRIYQQQIRPRSLLAMANTRLRSSDRTRATQDKESAKLSGGRPLSFGLTEDNLL